DKPWNASLHRRTAPHGHGHRAKSEGALPVAGNRRRLGATTTPDMDKSSNIHKPADSAADHRTEERCRELGIACRPRKQFHIDLFSDETTAEPLWATVRAATPSRAAEQRAGLAKRARTRRSPTCAAGH